MHRLYQIEINHLEAKASIAHYQNDECAAMVHITQWLLNTEYNEYSFLPEAYAYNFNTSSGFAALLSNIHHALVDDGDICFPVINGEPRICFRSIHDENPSQWALTDTDKDISNRINRQCSIKFLEDVYAFTRAKDEYMQPQNIPS